MPEWRIADSPGLPGRAALAWRQSRGALPLASLALVSIGGAVVALFGQDVDAAALSALAAAVQEWARRTAAAMSQQLLKEIPLLHDTLGLLCPCLLPRDDHQIFRACESASAIEAVRAVLRADSSAVDARRADDAATPLHVAVMLQDLDLVRLLVNSGAPIEATDFEGRTPLHVSALNGNLALVSLLLESLEARSDFLIDRATKHGHTAMFLACWRGHLDSAQRLHAAGASILHLDREGKSMLQRAQEWNQTRVVQWLQQQMHVTLTPPRSFRLPSGDVPPPAHPPPPRPAASSPQLGTNLLDDCALP